MNDDVRYLVTRGESNIYCSYVYKASENISCIILSLDDPCEVIGSSGGNERFFPSIEFKEFGIDLLDFKGWEIFSIDSTGHKVRVTLVK